MIDARYLIALAARADDRRHERRAVGVGDVVDLEAVEVADEGVVALEREVRVDEAEVAGVRGVEESGGLVGVALGVFLGRSSSGLYQELAG